MKNIVVVGSLNMDLVVRVSHLPLTGETIFGHDGPTVLSRNSSWSEAVQLAFVVIHL